MSEIKAEWLGSTRYKNSLIMQDRRVEMLRMGKEPVLLGCEHEAVITLGRRANEESELKKSREDLKKMGISVVKIHRGGQATLHSPGQLVIYPIIDLKALSLGIKEYVNLLMAITRKVLANYGINTAFVVKNPGLYTDNGKICFFGIRVSRGITSHGIAINVNNDLGLFSNIRSCGKDHENFDSFAKRGIDADCQSLFSDWNKEFQLVFSQFLPKEESKELKKPRFPLTRPPENNKK